MAYDPYRLLPLRKTGKRKTTRKVVLSYALTPALMLALSADCGRNALTGVTSLLVAIWRQATEADATQVHFRGFCPSQTLRHVDGTLFPLLERHEQLRCLEVGRMGHLLAILLGEHNRHHVCLLGLHFEVGNGFLLGGKKRIGVQFVTTTAVEGNVSVHGMFPQ
jgi:hypothetical protein